jgi:hypothetical protein
MHLLNVLQNPEHLIYDKEQPLQIMPHIYVTARVARSTRYGRCCWYVRTVPCSRSGHQRQ